MAAGSTEQALMARALTLAANGRFTTDPNPRVGCLIVKDGEIVAEGWHQAAGQPHAEIVALKKAGERARQSTVVVTLEPCVHHGRTPPCVDALIAAGVRRVVFATEDPNPNTQGAGAKRLAEAGVEVLCGLLQRQARDLNQGFFKRMARGRPYLRTKIAASLDGRTALKNGRSQWITGPAARQDVHLKRAAASVIVTGSGTILADNPRLTARLESGQEVLQPARAIVDSRLTTPPDAAVFAGDSEVLLFTRARDLRAAAALEKAGGQLERQPGEGRVDLGAMLDRLGELEFNEAWVEAGPGLNGALCAEGLIDEIVVYLAPILLGDQGRGMFALGPITDLVEGQRLIVTEHRWVGSDLRLHLRPEHTQKS